MPICRDMLWGMTNHRQGLLEELFGGIHIPLFAQPRINQVPILVNRPIEVTPFAVVKGKPRVKNISATSRRLSLYLSRHKTASNTISVGKEPLDSISNSPRLPTPCRAPGVDLFPSVRTRHPGVA
jgi:hypothetical protein